MVRTQSILPWGGFAPVRRRAWPIFVTLASLALGLAFSLLWAPIVRHRNYWIVPGDIWGAYRSAHFIAWGSLGSIYAAGSGLVTFPGILLVLAPMTMLSGHWGMSEAFPYTIAHPTAWLLLGPYEILISCTAIFACDALAEQLGVDRRPRRLLCIGEGLVLWNVSVLWGHPEDALALALALYALVLGLEGRWSGAGWLIGAAVVTQPMVLLMVPVLVAVAGTSRAVPFLIRGALPSAALLATPLVAEFHSTVHALIAQPNFPNIDHVTPWTSLAPRLGGSGEGTKVAAGPGRVMALAAACLIGWWVRRWKGRPDIIVLAVAAAFALRCLTESVMVSFYVWPALAVGLVTISVRSRWRLLLAVGIAAAVTVSSNSRLGEWPWWEAVNGGTLAILMLGIPSRPRDAVPIHVDAGDAGMTPGASGVLAGATR